MVVSGDKRNFNDKSMNILIFKWNERENVAVFSVNLGMLWIGTFL